MLKPGQGAFKEVDICGELNEGKLRWDFRAGHKPGGNP